MKDRQNAMVVSGSLVHAVIWSHQNIYGKLSTSVIYALFRHAQPSIHTHTTNTHSTRPLTKAKVQLSRTVEDINIKKKVSLSCSLFSAASVSTNCSCCILQLLRPIRAIGEHGEHLASHICLAVDPSECTSIFFSSHSIAACSVGWLVILVPGMHSY